MKSFDNKQNDLASLLFTREDCFTGIQKVLLLIPFLLGLPSDWPPISVWLCPHGGSSRKGPPTHTASPLICRQHRKIGHPKLPLLTASTPCSLGHPPSWRATVSHSFSRFCIKAPHLLLISHCSTQSLCPTFSTINISFPISYHLSLGK